MSRPRFLTLLLDRAGVTLELVDHNHPKVSRSLARLEDLSLVKRADARHDRRIKTAAVTAKGHRTVEAINHGRRRLLEEAFADWTDRDRKELARLTRRFSDGVYALVEAYETGS